MSQKFSFSSTAMGYGIFILFFVTIQLVKGIPTKLCPDCEMKYCPKNITECPKGVLPDPCDCCPVGLCSLPVGARCLQAGMKISETALGFYGLCSDLTECVQREDFSLVPDEDQPVCSCKTLGPVCGSDQKTYESICTLMEAQANEKFIGENSLWLSRTGPCDSQPEIVAGPTNSVATVSAGDSLALDCEVRGYPVPTITWEFQALDGSLTPLPGDNPDIVVQIRGGPDRYMVTSWVQIIDVSGKNAGTYTCVASNREGITHSIVTVNINI